MKETKRISLATFIVTLLVMAAICVVLIYMIVSDKNKDNKEENKNKVSNSGVVNNQNSGNNDINNSSSDENKFKPANYVIQFDANLLGEEQVVDELNGCNYEISFLDNNKFTAYMYFGNWIEGSYTISNNIINCIITSASGEYSPTQKTEGKISFKINSDSEIEIIDIPKSYTIRTTELSPEGWVLTDKTKEMGFWPLVEGIKFVSNSDENKVLTEKEARDILNQKYEVLRKLNVLSEEYFKINNEAIKYDEYTFIHLIENYDEVVNKYFSNNMKKVFDENAICLKKFEGKHWIAEGGEGFSTYGGVEEFKDITITDTKVSVVLKTKHYDGERKFTGYKESKFILVKEGNDWLIDEFDFSVLR